MNNMAVRTKQKKIPHQRGMHNYQYDSLGIEELLELFPLPRYFQIHFGHIHDNTEQAMRQLDELKQRIERVEEKLDQLLAVMDKRF